MIEIAVLTLGILLLVVLTFAAALIAGVRVPTATVIAVALTAALCFSQWRSGGPTLRS